MKSLYAKKSIRVASILFITFVMIAAAALLHCDEVFAFAGPSNPHWSRTRAVWDAETSSDGRATIYYFKLYEVTDSGDVEIKSVTLTNQAYYDVSQTVIDRDLQGKTLKFKVSFKFAGGYVSNESTSGNAEFRYVELKDPENPFYVNTAVAGLGDIMYLPDPPIDETDDYFFGGWSASSSGSPLWNFERDKVTEDKFEGDHLILYATWVPKNAHKHDSISFKPWIYNDRLPESGDYYLVDDVYLSSTQNMTGTVNLCLNGKTIQGKDNVRAMNINTGADVRIYDENGDGSIQGNSTWQSYYDAGVILIKGGSLTLNNGQNQNGQADENGGNVSLTSGQFTMNGGSITGGVTGTRGGGVYVSGSSSIFTMNGGTISGNIRRYAWNPSYGGGIAVVNGGHFRMSGGTITGNQARKGSGIYANSSDITISGGAITGNICKNESGYTANGGGIWVYDVPIKITAGSNGTKTDKILITNNGVDNVFAHTESYADAGKAMFKIEAEISSDSRIGIAKRHLPKMNEDAPGRLLVTEDLTESGNESAEAFFSDNGALTVVYENGEAWLTNYWKILYDPGDHGTGDMSEKNARVIDEESYTIEENGFTPDQYYEFTGWKAGNSEFKENEPIEKVEKNYTFTAQWKPTEYALSCDLAGGSLPEGETNPETFTGLTDTFTLVNPERSGYEFIGWTGTGLDGPSMEVTIPQGTTENKEYTANWQLIEYTITYRLNTGKLPEGQSNPTVYTVETDTFTLVNPELRGHTFVGWLGTGLDSETPEVTIEKGSTGNRTYNANYEEGCPDGKHNWGAWETVKEPKCTQPGEKTRACEDCGAAETGTIPAIGHDYEFTE